MLMQNLMKQMMMVWCKPGDGDGGGDYLLKNAIIELNKLCLSSSSDPIVLYSTHFFLSLNKTSELLNK